MTTGGADDQLIAGAQAAKVDELLIHPTCEQLVEVILKVAYSQSA